MHEAKGGEEEEEGLRWRQVLPVLLLIYFCELWEQKSHRRKSCHAHASNVATVLIAYAAMPAWDSSHHLVPPATLPSSVCMQIWRNAVVACVNANDSLLVYVTCILV